MDNLEGTGMKSDRLSRASCRPESSSAVLLSLLHSLWSQAIQTGVRTVVPVASSLEVPSLLADPKGATSSEDYEDAYAHCKGLSTLTLHSRKIELINRESWHKMLAQNNPVQNGMERNIDRIDVKKWGDGVERCE
jgi:hypothetical protein